MLIFESFSERVLEGWPRVSALPKANQHAGVDGSAAPRLGGVLSTSVSCKRGAFFIIKVSVSPRRGAFDERLVQARCLFMIKVSVWCRRGAFLAAAAVCCGGFVGTLPGANQGAGVDYWRPVRRGLALCLTCAWRRLGLNLWGAGETAIMSQSAAHSVQIGYAVPKAQEKPSVSFI